MIPAAQIPRSSLPIPSELVLRAPTAEIALRLAKRALGDDALVVGSRAIDEGSNRSFEVHATSAGGSPGGPKVSVAAAAPTVDTLERLLREEDVPASLARALVLSTPMTGPRLGLPDRLLTLLRTAIGFGDAGLSTARTVALVGPTGVGKTTTIAKLAALDALVHRRRIGLVSLDDHRLGGAAQLGLYAELIGVPFEVAEGAGLERALAKLSHLDRVYVDTAGRAPRDRHGCAFELERLRAVGNGLGVALCVPAASRASELETIVEAYAPERGPVRPRALVVTKLDEAVLVGAAVTAAATTRLPIAFLTTGQRVPEDIEVATADRLARAMGAHAR